MIPPGPRLALAAVLLAPLLLAGPAGAGPAGPRRRSSPRPPAREATPPAPSYQLTDVESLIGIRSRQDILERRRALARVVFGADTVPRDLKPVRVEPGIQDRRFAGLGGLESIDRLTCLMDPGIDSKIYYLKARRPDDVLVIYHHGHSGGFEFALDALESFLTAGHDVLALSMPLEGMNNRPVVTIDRVGTFQVLQHGWLFFLERPLRFFMEPIAAALNHALGAKPYSRVAMAGFSGGGWSTTLYAAMDERISSSYPVAGSMPNYLRAELSDKEGTWDAEQLWLPMLREANYLEMYVLGASGKGRRQIQILIQGDPHISQAKTFDSYERVVAGRVRSLGPGEFRVFVDVEGYGHKLTPGAVARIVADLAGADPGASGGPSLRREERPGGSRRSAPPPRPAGETAGGG